MKRVVALVKPIMLPQVREALCGIEGLTGASVSQVDDVDLGRPQKGPEQEREEPLWHVPHVRIEIVCHDELAEQVVTSIQASAHTGLRADGRIYVSGIEQVVHIGTGECGDAAL